MRLRMSVVDNGIGIEPATLDRLFTSFMQAEATTTRRFGGSGLGLAICKRLVELMGGSIQVRSEPRVGSTFSITLPIEAIGTALKRHELAGLDCIVIAGPAIDADDLGTYLEHAGARVAMAPGGRSAARHAARLGDGAVVVIQHCGAGATAVETARAPFGTRGNVRHVLLSGSRRKSADMIVPGVVILETALLRRSSLLRAVAAAGGRTMAPDPKAAARPTARPHRRTAPSIAQARAQNRLILVAEDDEVNRKVILKQLALLGHAAEVAGNGAEALRLWREGGHALLLSDLHMPELDGYGLARAIRDAESRQPGPQRLPILALTANALRDEAQQVRAAGMDQYLTKPIQLQALAAALDRWMPSAATASALAATAATAPTMPAPAGKLPLDVSVLKSLVGDDMATVCDFLSQFLESARAQAAEISASCEREDNRRVGAVAHKLKASSRSVGALALGDLCAELENVSVAGSKAELAAGRARFESELREVQSCIHGVLAETAP